jgi:hypothetical protein
MVATLPLFRHFLSKAAKAAIEFTPFILEVITGILLGDGHLRMIGQYGRGYNLNRRIKICFLLWNLFNTIGIVGALPCTIEQYDKRTGKTYIAYFFGSLTLPFLATLHKVWYVVKDGKYIKFSLQPLLIY